MRVRIFCRRGDDNNPDDEDNVGCRDIGNSGGGGDGLSFDRLNLVLGYIRRVNSPGNQPAHACKWVNLAEVKVKLSRLKTQFSTVIYERKESYSHYFSLFCDAFPGNHFCEETEEKYFLEVCHALKSVTDFTTTSCK